MDVGDTASVTTGGVTMDLVITAEGKEGHQYPGFFPEGPDSGSSDQAKGIELAEGDTAVVSLSAPLSYSQWIFTDVDQPNEGFTVTPAWTVPGQAAAFGGDLDFTFAETTALAVKLNDTNGQSENSESINGRVQVDFLGAVTGIAMERTSPSQGQSGFAVGGGYEAAGAAKVIVDGPTWNGTSFDVTYELRNNLPSSATIQSVIDDAIAGVGASIVTGTPQGISLNDLQLTEDLRDDAFSTIEATALSTSGNLVLNQNFDGYDDLDLISSGDIAAEASEVITLSVQYTHDHATAEWNTCTIAYDLLNQTELTARAANVDVVDLSDNGTSAAPSDNNGAGGVDDPTPVSFPCPPGALDIVKTAVAGPNGSCPTFANGVQGDGPALPVTFGDVGTYCLTVRNAGPGPISNVIVADAQAPRDFLLNNLAAGETDTASYDVEVDLSTPLLNTATATADGVGAPVQDTALIDTRSANISLIHSVSKADEDCTTSVKDENSLVANSETLAITWCAKTTNNGNVALTNVILDAPDIGSGDPIDVLEGTGSNVLLPGESVVVLVAGEMPDSGLISDAKVEADPSDVDGNMLTGVARPSDDDTAEVREASISLEATAAAGADSDCADAVELLVIPNGQDMTWCFAVTNTGAIGLLVTQVTDQALDVTAAIPSELQDLGPGVTIFVAANDVVEGPATIDADVKGKPLGSSGAVLDQAPEVWDVDPARVVIPGAELALVKETSGTGRVTIGQVVTYTLTITNNGPCAASGVRVVDELPVGISYLSLPANDDWACSFDDDLAGFGCLKGTDLANGVSVTLSYTARINESAPVNTDLLNVAEVSSETPDDNLLNNNGDAKAIRPPPPTPTVKYPGPFPTPTPTVTPPDEVLGLADTGASSNLLGLLSAAMLTLSGLLALAEAARTTDLVRY